MEYHVPVLLSQSIDGLDLKAGGVYLDLTFGGGGHSREILRRLKEGRLIAFDQDEAVEGNLFDDDRFAFYRSNYRFFNRFLDYEKIEGVDGVLADLGVSSRHFEDPSRGFSFRFDARLDMRMNADSELTAEYILNEYESGRLRRIISEYGELSNAGRIVNAITSARKIKRLETTGRLLEVLEGVVPENQQSKYLARLFQALRIEVNGELESLKDMLTEVVKVLKPGGRLSVISYHSLEDRLVKNLMKAGNVEGKVEKDLYGNVNSPFRVVNKKVIVPDADEVKNNNRARSAKLRIAERL